MVKTGKSGLNGFEWLQRDKPRERTSCNPRAFWVTWSQPFYLDFQGKKTCCWFQGITEYAYFLIVLFLHRCFLTGKPEWQQDATSMIQWVNVFTSPQQHFSISKSLYLTILFSSFWKKLKTFLSSLLSQEKKNSDTAQVSACTSFSLRYTYVQFVQFISLQYTYV